MRITIEEPAPDQISEAMDVLRIAGMNPSAGGTVRHDGRNLGFIVLRDEDAVRAVEVLKAKGVVAHISNSA